MHSFSVVWKVVLKFGGTSMDQKTTGSAPGMLAGIILQHNAAEQTLVVG